MSQLTQQKRVILLADEPEYLQDLKQALADQHLLEALNAIEVQNLMNENQIDLFIVGAHFDDSRAVQVINKIKKDERQNNAHILAVRLAPSDNPKILRDTFATMIKLKLIDDYLELDEPRGVQDQLRDAIDKIFDDATTGSTIGG